MAKEKIEEYQETIKQLNAIKYELRKPEYLDTTLSLAQLCKEFNATKETLLSAVDGLADDIWAHCMGSDSFSLHKRRVSVTAELVLDKEELCNLLIELREIVNP